MTYLIYGHWRSLTLHVILREVLTNIHNLLGTCWGSCLGLCVSYNTEPPLRGEVWFVSVPCSRLMLPCHLGVTWFFDESRFSFSDVVFNASLYPFLSCESRLAWLCH